MYVYGLGGVVAVDTTVPNAQNPIPAQADGFIYFDDGTTLYLSGEDGTNATPVTQAGGWIALQSTG
jgi:hypothetical protein